MFTLEGGTESYRTFMEMMDTGAAAVDAAGRLLYANHALRLLLGSEPRRLQGKPLAAAFADEAGKSIATLLASADSGRQPPRSISSTATPKPSCWSPRRRCASA